MDSQGTSQPSKNYEDITTIKLSMEEEYNDLPFSFMDRPKVIKSKEYR